MSTEKRKGDAPARDAAEDEIRELREGAGSRGAPRPEDDADPREEEGWSQPEASTQKGTTREPEDGGSGAA
jgi:hypothetical protein